MKKFLAACLALALVLSGCGVAEVDITNTPPSPVTAEPSPTPEPTPAPTPSPEPGDMVNIVDIIQDIYLDVRYATENNFTQQRIYDTAEVYLRYSTAEKLAGVQKELRELGYSLCVWDGWRPLAAQFALWRACPDATYVSNPFNGLSGHCRGNTVDITLVTLDGAPVEMPTDFDDFTAMADRDYSDVDAAAAERARLLERVMGAAGFTGYSAEWWHYTDTDSYDICESLTELSEVALTGETELRDAPDENAGIIAVLQANSEVYELDRVGDWLLVRSDQGYGYVKVNRTLNNTH